MHSTRLLSLAGVVVGIVGLALTSLDTEGEGLLAGIHAQNPDAPGGIPTIWGGLDLWAQWLVVILMIVLVILALRPPLRAKLDWMSALVTTVIGVGLLIYAIVKFVDAGDKADKLAALFGQLAAAGMPGVEAFGVGRGVGFVVLFVGTALVIFGGAMGLVGSSDE
jgi:hypothetical protein